MLYSKLKKSYELYVIPRSQTDVGVGRMSRDLPYLAKVIPEMFVTSMLWRENINGISLFTLAKDLTMERKYQWNFTFHEDEGVKSRDKCNT